MLCDICGASEAVVHITQVVNHQTTTLHLCERCAAERGLQAAPPLAPPPLADFLAKLGGNPHERVEQGEGGGVCPFCALTLEEFKRIGRLGCPQCYSAFDGYLRGLLRRIQAGSQHTGKVYLPPEGPEPDRERRLASLRKKLAKAVEAEDFEGAARLRDQIRALESSR